MDTGVILEANSQTPFLIINTGVKNKSYIIRYCTIPLSILQYQLRD